jgi:hypothetical protein
LIVVLNLETAVGSQKSEQALGAPAFFNILLGGLVDRRSIREDSLGLPIGEDNLIRYVSTIRATPDISMNTGIQ